MANHDIDDGASEVEDTSIGGSVGKGDVTIAMSGPLDIESLLLLFVVMIVTVTEIQGLTARIKTKADKLYKITVF